MYTNLRNSWHIVEFLRNFITFYNYLFNLSNEQHISVLDIFKGLQSTYKYNINSYLKYVVHEYLTMDHLVQRRLQCFFSFVAKTPEIPSYGLTLNEKKKIPQNICSYLLRFINEICELNKFASNELTIKNTKIYQQKDPFLRTCANLCGFVIFTRTKHKINRLKLKARHGKFYKKLHSFLK